MSETFTESTKLWILRQDVLQAEENRFKVCLARMFQAVIDRFHPLGWKTTTCDDLLQLSRPHWPSARPGLHFEAWAGKEHILRNQLEIGLHVEDDVPNQRHVWSRLCNLLRPYEQDVICHTKCTIQNHPDRVVKGHLNLAGLSSSDLCTTLEHLVELETFVDEALFLAETQTVWRTDFLAQDKKSSLEWHENLGTGPMGGWELSSDGGRFNSACLKCHGERSNYHEGKNILRLRTDDVFHDFHNGQEVCASAVVHASGGGEIQFYAEAPKEGKWGVAFDGACKMAPLDRWQVVTWRGTVACPDQWNFAEQGLYAFVMVKAPASGLRIDSIEFGTCNQ